MKRNRILAALLTVAVLLSGSGCTKQWREDWNSAWGDDKTSTSTPEAAPATSPGASPSLQASPAARASASQAASPAANPAAGPVASPAASPTASLSPADALAKAISRTITPVPGYGKVVQVPTSGKQANLDVMQTLFETVNDNVLTTWRGHMESYGAESLGARLIMLRSDSSLTSVQTPCENSNLIDGKPTAFVDAVLSPEIVFCEQGSKGDVVIVPVDSIRKRWISSDLSPTAKLAVIYTWFAAHWGIAYERDIHKYATEKLKITGWWKADRDPVGQHYAHAGLVFGYCVAGDFAWTYQSEVKDAQLPDTIIAMMGIATGVTDAQLREAFATGRQGGPGACVKYWDV